MTVLSLVNNVTYIADGVSTIYTYPFYILEASHLYVYVNGATMAPSGYTVNSVGNPAGGEVVFAVAPVAGLQIFLYRHVPSTQPTDYRPYDAFPAEEHEKALDRLTMIAQEGIYHRDRAIRASGLEPVGANFILPFPAVRANLLLGFDAAGNVVTYPFFGPPLTGITDHGALSGLGDDDHPQYMLRTDLTGSFLPLTGGTMTGAIQLPLGFPAAPTEAVNKNYVDTFIGSVITKNVISDATGDGVGTVEAGWNAQANALGITRASNEIIYYRWKSTDTTVYRYIGSQQGPAGWSTTAADWAASSGVNEAPMDGFIYGRVSAGWAQVVPKAGGAYTGKVQGPTGAPAAADLTRFDEVQAQTAAQVAAHEALLDPHPQYLTKTAAAAGPSVPIGTILDFAGTAVPTNYIWCNGQAVSRITWAALFAVIGTTWGAGDGSSTFNVPDLRRRTTVGEGGTSLSGMGTSIGDVGGNETVALTTAEMPAHAHGGLTDNQNANHQHSGTTGGMSANQTHSHMTNYNTTGGDVNLSGTNFLAHNVSSLYNYASNGANSNNSGIIKVSDSLDHTHNLTTGNENTNHRHALLSEGSGTAHNNMQPSAVVKKIIRGV